MSVEIIIDSKRAFIASILRFLEEETYSDVLSEQQKESIEVAVQCLQSTYEISDVEKIANQTRISHDGLKNLLQTNGNETAAENLKEQGNEAMKNAEFKRAVECYSSAIKLNPTNAKYFCNRAAAHDKMMKYEDAICDSKQAISLDPTYSKAFARMGNAFVSLGRYKEAKESYLNALKYDESNADYQENLNLCEEHLKNHSIPSNLSDLLNNPNILNLASQLLNDPNGVRNLVSTMMSGEGGGSDPNMGNLAQIFRDGMQMNNTSAQEFVASLNTVAGNSEDMSPKKE